MQKKLQVPFYKGAGYETIPIYVFYSFVLVVFVGYIEECCRDGFGIEQSRVVD